jgi:hypothetical protein
MRCSMQDVFRDSSVRLIESQQADKPMLVRVATVFGVSTI